MFQLCICDDDLNVLQTLEKYALEFCFQKNIDINITKLSSPERLVYGDGSFDIVFLDIQFDGDTNGIEVAKAIRQKGYQCLILFITVHEGFSIKGYEAEAFRFLVKPLGKEAVFAALDDCIRKLYSGAVVSIKTSLGDELVKSKEILYVMTLNRKRIIATISGGKLETWAQLKDIRAALPPDLFSMVQQGCLVNLDMVKVINGNAIVLTDGTELTLSRKFKESFLKDLRGHLKYS